MGKQLIGLDVLRGVGIFFVVALHSAFYYFGGLFQLDLNDPPVVVTVIGLLLMFAGLFAMISGLVHSLQFERRIELHNDPVKSMKHQIKAGLFVLVLAYLYFIFTGPGLAQFETASFDNSILVELIQNGRFVGLSQERILYVDSLVMLGTNAILCGLIAFWFHRLFPDPKRRKTAYFALAIGLFLFSLLRLPLYEVYLEAVGEQNLGVILGLNFFVNKNNPILPFLAFGVYGMWMTLVMLASRESDSKKTSPGRTIVPVGAGLFLIGVLLYIFLPDTMLERSIDMKWYSIMLAQLGLFSLLTLLCIRLYEDKRLSRKPGKAKIGGLGLFFYRFGIAGLTVFFFESVISGLVYRSLRLLWPELSFTIGQSLLYGLSIAILWGIFLILWEKSHYRYGIEYWYAWWIDRKSSSTKGAKLRGEL
ncbi:MAG: hypothetical protein CVU86_07780 [Firmicutes bacterium HGW-Firmicutes-11]|jgi:uncharacterized membrane protein YidH (DUF202 family)|nr:MAG: hypothetical protein CVU86_07780 [Firmicutes bacterium HGW-Firmicutes-11]